MLVCLIRGNYCLLVFDSIKRQFHLIFKYTIKFSFLIVSCSSSPTQCSHLYSPTSTTPSSISSPFSNFNHDEFETLRWTYSQNPNNSPLDHTRTPLSSSCFQKNLKHSMVVTTSKKKINGQPRLLKHIGRRTARPTILPHEYLTSPPKKRKDKIIDYRILEQCR